MTLRFPTMKKAPKYKWQDEALEAIGFFVDGKDNKGSIFKCFKQDEHFANRALIDCKELGKPYTKYFFKVYSELRKQYEKP